MNYSQSKHKIRTIYNRNNKIHNDIIISEGNENSQDLKLDFKNFQGSKRIYTFNITPSNLIDYDEIYHYYYYDLLITFINIPYYILPYIKCSLFYSSENENIIIDSNALATNSYFQLEYLGKDDESYLPEIEAKIAEQEIDENEKNAVVKYVGTAYMYVNSIFRNDLSDEEIEINGLPSINVQAQIKIYNPRCYL